MSTLIFDDDVVRKVQGSRVKLGLVLENYNTSDEENDSGDDSDSDEDTHKGKKGHVLIAWYPKGRTEVVPHDQVQLHDRSLMAGDLVQRSDSVSSSGQLGTVKGIHVTCNLQIHSTRQIIYDVSNKLVQPITRIYPGTFVLLDSWVGEVEDTTTEIVVVLKNGARCALSERAAATLTDVHDDSVEDSVFGESDGFYPGQMLWGRSTLFRKARWLSGQQPVMYKKSHFKVTVEGVKLVKLTVEWQTRGLKNSLTREGGTPAAPPKDVTGDDVQRAEPLQFFSADRVQVGDRGIYEIREKDIVSTGAVPKGSPMSYKKSSHVQSKKLTTVPPGSDGSKVKTDTAIAAAAKSESKPVKGRKSLGSPDVLKTKTVGHDEPKSHEQPKTKAKNGETMKSEICEAKDEAEGSKADSSEERDAVASKKGIGGDGDALRKSVAEPKASSGLSEDTEKNAQQPQTEHKEDEKEGSGAATSGDPYQFQALCDISAQFCEEYKSFIEMARSFRSAFSEEAANEVEKKMQGFGDTQSKLQEQISRSQRLFLRDGGKSSDGGKDDLVVAGRVRDRKGAEDSGNDLSSSDSGDDGNESDVSSSDSPAEEESRRPKRSGQMYRRRKRQSSAKEKTEPIKAGDMVSVEVTHTHTMVDVEWQDGTVSLNIEASALTPVELLEDMHFFPGDFVTKNNEDEENTYGVVRSLDYKERTCQVCWISKPNQQSKIPQVVGTEEISFYDLIPHPDFHISIGDTVVRIAYSSLPEGESPRDQPVAGEVLSIAPDGMVNVTWVDNSQSAVYPQDIYILEGDDSIASDSDEGEGDDDDEEDSGDGDSESESSGSESGSWETASEQSGSENDEDDDQNGENPEQAAKKNSVDKKDAQSPGSPDSDSGAKGDGSDLNARKDDAITNGDGTGGDVRAKLLTKNGEVSHAEAEKCRKGKPNDHDIESKAKKVEGLGPDSTSNGNLENDVISDDSKAQNGYYEALNGDQIMATQGVSTNDTSKEHSMGGNGLTQENINSSSLQGGTLDGKKGKLRCDKCGQSSASRVMRDATTSTDEDFSGDSRGVAAASKPSVTWEDNVDAARFKVKGAKSSLDVGEAEEGCSLGGVFTLLETTPESHHFYPESVEPTDQKKFMTALRKEVQLLKSSLPAGILVKGFEDKMHLFSALIEGPSNTPYEDCLFYFDGSLPDGYPRSPPVVHYHAFCPGKLNPNLYHEGRICLSLLDTWTGKGSEMWTKKSSLLQLLVSIQGLILNSEPYYNEAGYEKHRGSAHGSENSRMYNETALIKVIQSVTNMVVNPPDIFRDEMLEFYREHAPRLISRLEGWLDQSVAGAAADTGFPLFPLSRGFTLSARQVVSNLKSRWEEVRSTMDDS